jgi:putative transposase
MLITEKIKINPNKLLERNLKNLINAKRFIYNFMVNLYNKEKLNPRECRSSYRKMLKENKIINKNGNIIDLRFKEVLDNTPSQIEDMCSEDLKRAIKSYRKEKLLKFKSKRYSRKSFTIHRKNDNNFRFSNGLLKIVKINIPIKLYMDKFKYYTGEEKIKRITISNNTYGWYISISYELGYNPYKLEKTKKKIGIDWGIKAFATDSNGKTFTFKKRKKLVNYQEYSRLYKRLKELQKISSKKRLANET